MSDVAVYRAADRTIAAYHASKTLVRYIRGPRGSTKTTAALMTLWNIACTIKPGRDGVRRSRMLLARASYPSIERTILKSAIAWLGAFGTPRFTIPPVINFRQDMSDGTRVESEFVFMALPDEGAFQQFRSLELTAAFLNECVEMPVTVLTALIGSLNRYPALNTFAPEDLIDANGLPKPPYESVVLLDTNPTDEDSPWRLKFEDTPPDNAEVFIQPGAFLEMTYADWASYSSRTPGVTALDKHGRMFTPNPQATYAKHISGGYNYWAEMIRSSTTLQEVQTLVCNKWASSAAGSPVWPQYSDEEHRANVDLEPVPHAVVHVGLDHSGLHPAAVLGQIVAGQLRLTDEAVFEDNDAGMTFTQFVEDELVPLLQDRYSGLTVIVTLDPAIARSQIDGRTVLEVLTMHGITARPAPSNDPKMRRDAVARWLMRKKAFLISPHMRKTVKALRGGYHFAKNRTGGLKAVPNKDSPSSHPADALQYLCLGLLLAGAAGSSVAAPRGGRPLMAR